MDAKKVRSYPKERSDFKNVETKINHNAIPEYTYRPIIENFERLNKIADEIKSSPNTVVNFLVNVGLECFERSIPRLKDEIKTNVEKKIRLYLK